MLIGPATLTRLRNGENIDDIPELNGWTMYEDIDTSTGDFDAEKGAMTDYQIILIDPEGNEWIGYGGYYTAMTGHCFNHMISFIKALTETTEGKLKFKRLNSEAVLPAYAKEGDIGLDVVATSMTITDKYVAYGIGWAMEVPKGHGAFLFPRSSVRKTGWVLSNSVGITDQGYRGEVTFCFSPTARAVPGELPYDIGDRIGQIVILETPKQYPVEVDELSDQDRGGGFGSTGR